MEKLLNDGVVDQLREIFSDLENKVSIVYFGSKLKDCDYCQETRQLLEEITAISEKIELKVFDIDENKEIASQYQIERVPGFIIAGHNDNTLVDYGIHFSGIPSGHEFTSLVNGLLMVSRGDSGLSDQTRQYLAGLDEPISLQVFVTPSCPYCPRAVVLAHQIAFESVTARAEMVEATEFPDLSTHYGISGVPDTVINYGAGRVVGAVPEAMLLDKIKLALEN